MIQLNTKALEQTVNLLSAAINAAGSRVVNAQALNAKDQVLAAIAKHIDRPRPFTTNPNAYQADKPQFIYGAASARFYIKPLQSAYLYYVFFGGVRVPGDPGTSGSRMWVPTFNPASKDAYGGVPNNYVAKLAHQADRSSVKKNWNAAHVAFADVKSRSTGTTSWGFWLFPARSHYVTKQTVVINGRKRIKKTRHTTNIGEPILLLESRKETRYKPLIDLDALFELARQSGADKWDRYITEELNRRFA
jgi:hypothetical protein